MKIKLIDNIQYGKLRHIVSLLILGSRSDNVASVQLQGGPVEPGDDRVPVPDRQGALPGADAAGPQVILRDERQPGTKVSTNPNMETLSVSRL